MILRIGIISQSIVLYEYAEMFQANTQDLKCANHFLLNFLILFQELLHESSADKDKTDYVSTIISTIISTGRADDFITTICNVIQRLAIDSLHILGDIYDRGPGAHVVMDILKKLSYMGYNLGNHDILWAGACAGNDACICNVIRNCPAIRQHGHHRRWLRH